MRHGVVRLPAVVVGCALAAVGLLAQQPSQPPGVFRPRPAEGREPEFPPPSIREYKPRSTLVVPADPVPRARYPVVDFHGHPPALTGGDVVDRVVQAMDPIGVRVMVDVNGASGERLQGSLAAIRQSHSSDRMVAFTSLDLRGLAPGAELAWRRNSRQM